MDKLNTTVDSLFKGLESFVQQNNFSFSPNEWSYFPKCGNG